MANVNNNASNITSRVHNLANELMDGDSAATKRAQVSSLKSAVDSYGMGGQKTRSGQTLDSELAALEKHLSAKANGKAGTMSSDAFRKDVADLAAFTAKGASKTPAKTNGKTPAKSNGKAPAKTGSTTKKSGPQAADVGRMRGEMIKTAHGSGKSASEINAQTTDHAEGGRMRWALKQVQVAINSGKSPSQIGSAMATAYNAYNLDYGASGKKTGTMQNFKQNLMSYINSAQGNTWTKVAAQGVVNLW